MRVSRATALAVSLVAAACTPTQAADPIVDTWPIGEAYDCPEGAACQDLIRVGLAGLDARDPGHPPAVATQLHHEGTFEQPKTRKRIVMTRSGRCCQVLVVRLADGSTHAIGVGYPGVSKEAVAIPWEMAAPEPGATQVDAP
ncbi:MAG TPA: hypothetical protein VH720_09990 [Candidatus Limnocylindrales bacterium]